MLERLVGIVEHRAADGRTAGVGALPQQLGEPVAVPHLHVVVQQQQVIPAGVLPTKVVDAGKVEALLRVVDHLQAVVALPGFLIIGKGRRSVELFSMTMTSKFSQLVLVQMLCRHFSRSSVWSLFGMRMLTFGSPTISHFTR